MSTLSDLQKKLQQESEGIMFPFRTSAPSTTVKTTQPVLDTATDGIMSVTGEKYIGPDSVIQFSQEGQRQLKEIEKGMLPQFDQTQFPDIGKGRVEDRGGTAPTPPITTPVEPEQPAFDPCPPGFKLINGVCQPIEQDTGRSLDDRFKGSTFDTQFGQQAPGFTVKDRLNFQVSVLGQGGSQNVTDFYSGNNLINVSQDSISVNFNNIENLGGEGLMGVVNPAGMINKTSASLNMKGFADYFIKNGLATTSYEGNLDALSKKPDENLRLNLTDIGKSYVQNISTVNDYLFDDPNVDFDTAPGSNITTFLGTAFGQGGVGFNRADMNKFIIGLASQMNNPFVKRMFNNLNRGSALYLARKFGIETQDVTKFNRAIQDQYNEARKNDVMEEAEKNKAASIAEAQRRAAIENRPEVIAEKARQRAREKQERKDAGYFSPEQKEKRDQTFKELSNTVQNLRSKLMKGE